MHRNLHHAKAQRTHLPADQLQPARIPTVVADPIDLRFTHFFGYVIE